MKVAETDPALSLQDAARWRYGITGLHRPEHMNARAGSWTAVTLGSVSPRCLQPFWAFAAESGRVLASGEVLEGEQLRLRGMLS